MTNKKKKKKEVENMKSKYQFRRILSGVMAAVTILSTVISPLTVYASEEPKAAEPPVYEAVKVDLCQYFEHKKLKGYADFFNSSSSFCCGVI